VEFRSLSTGYCHATINKHKLMTRSGPSRQCNTASLRGDPWRRAVRHVGLQWRSGRSRLDDYDDDDDDDDDGDGDAHV